MDSEEANLFDSTVSLHKDHVRLSISDGNQSAGMCPTEIICELPMKLPCASVSSAFLVVLLQVLNQLGSHRSWQKAKGDILIKLKRQISPRTLVFKKDVCRARPWWAWTPVWENPNRLKKADLCFQIKVIFLNGDLRVHFDLLCSFLYQGGAPDSWLSPGWNKHP